MTDRSDHSIKAINKTSVHRICSGQVVLSLAIAIKELVENSLDAGATSVEVRLKEYGSELIEVSDNGSGVHPNNFQGLTLKHHTSKLREFSDIMCVETFGFRGEALSSLCALSDLSIITKHESQNCGTQLVFDHDGLITEKSQCARQVGTTVVISNLFSTLPVRHKEFHRNLKREFNKMTQLLYAYCLVSTGVKINCVNQTKKGGKTTFVSTQGGKNVKENIACIFGRKQIVSLLEFKEKLPSNDVLEELKLDADAAKMFKLEGYISSCKHGEGRSFNDRQFYFVNSRPCEPSKVIRSVNEVYHQFNMHQSPFVYLNISVTRESVDVNVTPDKRQIFLDQEKLLIATIKSSLLSLYENVPSTYDMNVHQKVNISEHESSSPKAALSQLAQWRHKSNNNTPVAKKRSVESTDGKASKQMRLDFNVSNGKNIENISQRKHLQIEEGSCVKNTSAGEHLQIEEEDMLNISDSIEQNEDHPVQIDIGEQSLDTAIIEPKEIYSPNRRDNATDSCEEINENVDAKSLYESVEQITPSELSSFSQKPSETNSQHLSQESGISVEFDEGCSSNSDSPSGKKCMNVNWNVDVLCNAVKEHRNKFLSEKKNLNIKFRAVIDPTKNSQAEQELSKEISKDMFSKMEIIGQFNLGFIITKLGSDLFIVDQHATDEKYNFETLQKSTTISNQILVIPQKLELTAVNESILIENLEIFRQNGFEFKIDDSAPVTQKVCLTAIPMSRNWVFGKEDIDELLFMLQDSPNSLCRPSRVRAMFASRACRKSVMIGTSLNRQEMRRLIDHMGEIEQPWNCPHGRPTMRHLVNLNLIN